MSWQAVVQADPDAGSAESESAQDDSRMRVLDTRVLNRVTWIVDRRVAEQTDVDSAQGERSTEQLVDKSHLDRLTILGETG